jgi:flagellar motor protein MotB
LPVAPVQKAPERTKPTGRPEDAPNPVGPPPGAQTQTQDQKSSPAQQAVAPVTAIVAVIEPAVPPPSGAPGDKSAFPAPPGWANQPGSTPGAQQTAGQGPGQGGQGQGGQAQGGQAQAQIQGQTRDIGQGAPIAPELRKEMEQRARLLDQAYNQLKQALSPLIGTGEVRVSLSSLGVVIDINEVLLFNSGKAELTPQALPLIDKVAGILKGLPYQVQVNGFTDTVPIHTAQFDSNWDLSATRAVSVVKRFVTAGIDPTKLVGAGFGEYHPVASNATPEGKAQNRRVSVVVVSPMQGENPMKTPLLGTTQSRAAASPTIPSTAIPSVP